MKLKYITTILIVLFCVIASGHFRSSRYGEFNVFDSLFLNGPIDMRDNPIVDVGYIDFNLVNGIDQAEGRAVWNDTDGTLNLGLKGGVVNLQIGQEEVLYGKNSTGSATTNGRPVRISGASGNNPEFGFSDADNPAAAGSVGLFTEDVSTNANGYVTTHGKVRDRDTTGTDEGEVWAAADRLYVSNTAGELTDTPPTGSERKIFIGSILRAHATEGVIWVHPINVSYPHELSGVDPGDLADNVILQYNSGTGVWSLTTTPTFTNIYLTETTTPTPIADHGALYTTSDNELFFQDGAGTNHLLHGDAFSNIWFHGTSSVDVAITVQGAFTKVDSFTVVGHEDDLSNAVGSAANDNITLSSIGGGEYEISYHGSVTATGGADKEMSFAVGITLATPKDITNVTDDTVSPIVITSVAHGLENGDMVEIAGVLVNTAANGSFIVDSKADDTFVIVDLDGSATTGNGDYDEGTPTGDVTIFYPGNLEVHRMVRGADFGSISATAFDLLANDDVIALYVTNLSGVTNLTVSSISLGLNRIGD